MTASPTQLGCTTRIRFGSDIWRNYSVGCASAHHWTGVLKHTLLFSQHKHIHQPSAIRISPSPDHAEDIELPLDIERCPVPDFAGEDDEFRPVLRWIVQQKIIVTLPAEG